MGDAFGRALLDHYRGERETPLRQRDGDDVLTHPVGDFYFGAFADEPGSDWVESQVEGPVLDAGAGAGRDALHFQRDRETVAIDVSEHLVTLLDERGVDDARAVDMFALPGAFDADRFGTVLVLGTQVGLAKSRAGLASFLADLRTVVAPGGRVVLDCYDPTYEGASEMLGFRADPTPGLAYRTMHYEYGDVVGRTLLFRLFSPDRLREAAADADWEVTDVQRPHGAYYYRAALARE